MIHAKRTLFILFTLTLLTGGCSRLTFPREPISRTPPPQAVREYDTTGDGRADFRVTLRQDGRVDTIGFDTTGDGQIDTTRTFDATQLQEGRHLVIILDGFAWDVVQAYYDSGGLRFFHRPGRVIAPYPSMTDLAISQLLAVPPPAGFEATYFDAWQNRAVGGAGAYLSGANMPYNAVLDYRAGLMRDVLGYVDPKGNYRAELENLLKTWQQSDRQEVLAYLVTTAGIGTAHGRDGQLEALRELDRLIHQVIHDSGGKAKVTLMSDHGHSYTPSQRIPLETVLTSKGYRVRRSLEQPNDVVLVPFGLVTYASISTKQPAKVAEAVSDIEGVALASYAAFDRVVVVSRNGQATIEHRNARFAYRPRQGDPLELLDRLETIEPDADGFYDADVLLAATADAPYPAPLQRLWAAHYTAADHRPDVIISLADGWYYGAEGFAGSVDVASTHGSLNRINSTAFIMSTLGPLPGPLRSADVPAAMAKLLDKATWPGQK